MKIKINGIKIQAQEGKTILETAKEAGIDIPTLCHLNLHEINLINNAAVCGVCKVEAGGALVKACTTEVLPGMEICTNTEKTRSARKSAVENILANHHSDCLTCERNLTCELQRLASEMRISKIPEGEGRERKTTGNNPSIVYRSERCIECKRCETVCGKLQTVNAPQIGTDCTFCAQCVAVCPTGALTEKSSISKVREALNDPEKYVVVQTAPSIRVSLGELFGLPAGLRVTGKMVTALRRIGFDRILDTAFGADVTVTEEAAEFLHRLESGGRLPIITSCCPAWVRFAEQEFPESLTLLSSCKSPHQIFGALAKSYLAERLGIDPKKMVVVSVMPCLAKKYEAAKEELSHPQHGRDVDYVISTRELALMMKESCIDFEALPNSKFDTIMGESTGAGVGFGTTGGVITAVMRTVYARLEGKPPSDIDFKELRGPEGIREVKLQTGGREIAAAVAYGLGNARRLLENIRDGKAEYHAVEIMACPAGCVGGGGQPYYGSDFDVVKARSDALRRAAGV